MLARFLVLCLCAILSIWLLQMRTSGKVLTLFMIEHLQMLSTEFSRSNPVIISFSPPPFFPPNLDLMSYLWINSHEFAGTNSFLKTLEANLILRWLPMPNLLGTLMKD